MLSARPHHLGIVVANIETYLGQSLWQPKSAVVTDPLQKSRLCLTGLAEGDLLIELVEPVGEGSPTWAALERGGGWHHLCLAVGTREHGDALMRERRLLPVTPWQPAVLFDGRPVRFAYNRNRELLELFADGGTR